jgi:hypothetical protein
VLGRRPCHSFLLCGYAKVQIHSRVIVWIQAQAVINLIVA